MAGGEPNEAQRQPEGRRAGFWATVRTVLWSFFGVRRRADHHRDAASLDPKAVVVAGILGGVLFVLALVVVVRLVVGLYT